MDRRSFAADDRLPRRRASAGDRQYVTHRLGEEDGIAVQTIANQLIELAAIPPGASCRSWAVKRTEPAVSPPESRSGPDRFDRRGEATFHVGGTAAGQAAVLDRGRDERQVNRVKMPVELKRPSRPAAVEADHDGRRFGVSPVLGVHFEAISREDLRQAVADRASSAGRARHFDQALGGLDEPLTIHMRLEAFGDRRIERS